MLFKASRKHFVCITKKEDVPPWCGAHPLIVECSLFESLALLSLNLLPARNNMNSRCLS